MSAYGRLLPIEAVRRTSALSCTTFMLWLYQRHALKASRASVGDENSYKADCILVQKAGQALKIHSYLSPLKTYCPSRFRALT